MDAARPAPSTTAEDNSPSTVAEVSQDASHSQYASVEGSTGSESFTSLRTEIRQIKEKRIRRNNKRLIVGTRVSGPHGELVQNLKGHGRRVRDMIIGSIVASCDNNNFKVKFDNGTVKECSSSSLKIEDIVAALPPNEIPQDVREQIEEEGDEIIEDDGESDDEEDFI